jgi:hypothetical protein
VSVSVEKIAFSSALDWFARISCQCKMSVNLSKNKAQIQEAWKKVVNNEDGYDWLLLGYEGRSFDLKVVR